ncbi:hypothetical protein [Pelagibius marinus]|uniref:hypothetical protein n=1 Tax=Pelagibius marinus TaxID=2762760 RepID=UPI001872ACF5|nr:hypothetical protein [Pelagibius marinus]
MPGKPEALRAAGLFALFAAVLLAAAESYAAVSCADQIKRAKRHTGDVNVPRPHMGTAARHVAAAEAALRSGDEAKCLEEVKKTEKWIRMNRTRRGDR